jgi:hypothetical protein
MALNDLYKVVVRGGQVTNPLSALNVFFYRDIVGLGFGGANALAGEFLGEFMPPWAALINDSFAYREIEVVNLYDPADFFAQSILFTGVVTGDPLPLFNAYGFKCPRTSGTVRSGAKRFGGCSESSVDGNGVNPAVWPDQDALASMLGDTLTVTLVPTFEPRIVGRIPYVAPSGRTAYRLPQNQGEEDSYQALTWVANRYVTSQVSRKQGA